MTLGRAPGGLDARLLGVSGDRAAGGISKLDSVLDDDSRRVDVLILLGGLPSGLRYQLVKRSAVLVAEVSVLSPAILSVDNHEKPGQVLRCEVGEEEDPIRSCAPSVESLKAEGMIPSATRGGGGVEKKQLPGSSSF